MSDRLRHRGPDDSGSWADEDAGVAFGFRRLSIIDTSQDGHQPMHSESGRYTVAFNGEIYNYRELRAELEGLGSRFVGHSDTEVLLAAFDAWGVRTSIRRFAGMFALALWDRQPRQLSLITDRLGIKPLYLYWQPGMLSFASELKSLACSPLFNASVDYDALTTYFRYLYIPAPRTIFLHTSRLLPGRILTVSDPAATLPESTAYWSLEKVALDGIRQREVGFDAEAMVSAADTLCRKIVGQHMHADVPLGVFLSGGIDSSLVAALMQKSATRPVRTLSIAFAEKEYNEAHHATLVASHLGTDHTELPVVADDALRVIPELSSIFDEPFANPAAIANYLICRLARDHVGVALAGTGGDELFAGYNRHIYGERLLRYFGVLPYPARRAAGAALMAVPRQLWSWLHEKRGTVHPAMFGHEFLGEKLWKLGTALGQDSPAHAYRSLLSAWQEPEDLVIGGTELAGTLDRVFESELPGADWLDRLMLVDQLTYLVGDQLTMMDRVSMAVSLEVRVPLLDHRLVEFTWQLPTSLKRHNGVTKWMLRQILYRHVPRELLERPKMGLSLPIAQWLRGPLRGWAEDRLAENQLSGTLEPAPVQTAWRELLRGQDQHALALWCVALFQEWNEQWGS